MEAVIHECPRNPSCRYCQAELGMQDEAGVLDWSFLDGVYCISLIHRNDRMEQAACELHRVGLCRKVLFYRPSSKTGSRKARIRIWESHRCVARHALARGDKRILILEDDILFTNRLDPARLLSIGQRMARLPPDWMGFYLGHWPVASFFVAKGVVRTFSLCTHAYIASERLIEWLSEHPASDFSGRRLPFGGKGIDAVYARLPGMYAMYPMLAYQREGQGDHTTNHRRRLKAFADYLVARHMRTGEIIAIPLGILVLVYELGRRFWFLNQILT